MSAGRIPRILHVHPTFDRGAREERCVQLINAWGREADHAIVSGDPAKRGAAHLIGSKAKISWPKFPSLAGKPTPGRLNRIGAAMAGYDLICTYDWGAMDAVMAHTLLADVHKLAPLVHHEDGADESDAQRRMVSRSWYRRIALGRSAALVVPTKALEKVALDVWQQPRSRVRRIPTGIDTRAWSAPPRRDVLPRLIKRRGEFWIGCAASLTAGNDLDVLVRLMRRMPDDWHMVILGEGPEREDLLRLSEEMGVEDRVHLPGAVDRANRVFGLFDIYAAWPSAGLPVSSVIGAMAAALPVVAPRGDEIAGMLASDNGPWLYDPADREAMFKTFWRLSGDAKERKRIGQANRARAREEFDALRMAERYRALYWGLMSLPRPGESA